MQPEGDNLFDRVVSILEQARSNIVRAVNNNMVIAYWLICREVIQEIQGGDERAEYGKQVIELLSAKLNHKYSRGFSTTNLRYFRTFYTVYSNRIPEIRHIACGEFKSSGKRHTQSGVLDAMALAVEQAGIECGFSPNLGWSHYRALMNVEHQNERLFYEIEAENEGWEVKHLKRQIHTFLFARLLKSRDKETVMELACQGQRISTPADTIKNPYILDFLGLPDFQVHHESEIEKAIIDNLQSFIHELGKGFAFVGGQSDHWSYSLRKKNKTIARYSVLNESKQLFASKYMPYLPTEEELERELERERRLIEERQQSGDEGDQGSD